MSSTAASAHRARRGQALVEFALVAPIFFLVLFAIIEAGRFIYYYEILNNATREGARYAIVHGENSFLPTGPGAGSDPAGDAVIEKVRVSSIGIPPSSVAVIPTWWDTGGFPGTNERGQTVNVHASYSYSSLIPLVPLPEVTVEAESILVVNN